MTNISLLLIEEEKKMRRNKEKHNSLKGRNHDTGKKIATDRAQTKPINYVLI